MPPGLQRGTYLLLLRLDRPAALQIGSLGRCVFPVGYYLYAGSALGPGGLGARLRHHLRAGPRPHWHVDYLRRRVCLEQVWYTEQARRREHDWAWLARYLYGAAAAVPGFGSSDCNCPTHLFHLEEQPCLTAFQDLVRQHFPQDAPVRGLDLRFDAPGRAECTASPLPDSEGGTR